MSQLKASKNKMEDLTVWKFNNTNELFHHGVKGMKWGVRKDIASSASSAFREASNVAGSASKRSGLTKKQKKQVGRMSDQELRARINRMQMEQQYANLNPSKVSRGASVAQSILSTAGSVALITAATFGIIESAKRLKG